MTPRAFWAGRTLAFVGIAIAAMSMRTAVAGFSPLIPAISETYELSTFAIALIGSIAPLSFATGGIITPRIERRIGLERTIILALVMITAGHIIRAMSFNWQSLAIGTLSALLGMGLANVAMPPIVRKYFPDRVGTLTAVYMSIMSISAFLPALIAVPVAEVVTWRGSLAQWAIFAVLALAPWIVEYVKHRKDKTPTVEDTTDTAIHVHPWRSPTAWAVGIVFAVSSITGYAMYAWLPVILIDISGSSPAEAGAILALFAATGLPLAFFIPGLAKKMKRHVHWLVTISSVFFLIGYLGLLLFPQTNAWLWVGILGIGCLEFPLAVVLINLRTETQRNSMALSGFSQIIAYVSAALAPTLMGVLYSSTHDWTVVLYTLMIVSIVANIPAALILRRDKTVDAEITKFLETKN